MIDPQTKYKFNYNEKGAIIPPQTMGTPFGFALAMSAFLLPVVPRFQFFQESLSPFIFQYLPSFWALRKVGLLSNRDLASIETFTALYLLARLAYFPAFKSRYLSFFSAANPPPREMSQLWPSQISGSFKVGAAAMVGSLLLGFLAYLENILSAKYAFCVVESFGGGCVYLTEGLLGFGLYRAFKKRFWYQTAQVMEANLEGRRDR